MHVTKSRPVQKLAAFVTVIDHSRQERESQTSHCAFYLLADPALAFAHHQHQAQVKAMRTSMRASQADSVVSTSTSGGELQVFYSWYQSL
jgi:hypothetical protein